MTTPAPTSFRLRCQAAWRSRATKAFHRLSRFGSTVAERASPVWKSAMVQFQRGLQWLRRRWRPVSLVIVGCLLLDLGLLYGPRVWSDYRSDRDSFTPFFTPIVALLVGLAAFGQWRTARLRHEEQTNADRQRRITESFSKAVEQLGSDKLEVRLGGIYSLERISKESPDDYWTVMENLTTFVRERSRRNEAERLQDFEQRVSRCAYFLWREAGQPSGRAEAFWAEAVKEDEFAELPAADIAAVLTVIKRRSELSRGRERINAWFLDLRGAILKQAYLGRAHLEDADLFGAHLEGVDLAFAHLERATLVNAHLEGAHLGGAHLEQADLHSAHLEGAILAGPDLETGGYRFTHEFRIALLVLSDAQFEEAVGVPEVIQRATLSAITHLEGACLNEAHLERAELIGARLEGASLVLTHLEGADLRAARLKGANLRRAHLEGTDLRHAIGLEETQLAEARGDSATQLPAGMTRPAHWPDADPSPTA